MHSRTWACPTPARDKKRIYLPGGLPHDACIGVNRGLPADQPVVLELTSRSAVGTLFPAMFNSETARRNWLRTATQLQEDRARIDDGTFTAMCGGGMT